MYKDLSNLTKNNEKFMTVKEVAKILNVDERTVQRHAKEMFPEIIQNGKQTFLNEINVTAIKLKIERSGRNDLGNVAELPKTDLVKEKIIFQAWQFMNEKIERLEKESLILKPKAIFYDQVTGSTDTIDMREVASVLNIEGLGRNKLFAFLRSKKILDKDNQPYRQFIDSGYFRVIESKYENAGEIKISFKTVVFQKGLDYILKKLKEDNK
jgi:phage antirepressor YoqD-like protein